MKKLFKKGFYIELDDALQYPSSEKICEVIEAFCQEDNQNCAFVSRNSPVTFQLQDILYTTTVSMAHGGYILHCTEV